MIELNDINRGDNADLTITVTNGGVAVDNSDFVSDTKTGSFVKYQLFSIGSKLNGGLWYARELDEVGMWNRSLTIQEISDLYNGGSGLTY